MNYCSDLWVGVLAGTLIDNCVNICKENCMGCKSGLKSPMLHLHDKLSLLDKFKIYLNESRKLLTPKISDIYDAVECKLPHSGNKTYDKEHYCSNAKLFILNVTPESLFYGRCIKESNDCVIYNFLHPKVVRKRSADDSNKKRSTKRVKVDLIKTILKTDK